MRYFDTSALVKQYLKEAGSKSVLELLKTGEKVFTASLTFPLPHWNSNTLLTCNLVTGQCFAQHGDNWSVPGKKHSVCRLIYVSPSSGNV